MTTPTPVRFYFDFISPYSYLASQRIAARPEFAALAWDPRPVALGSVFSSLGVRAPGEIPSRRRRVMEDLLLLTQAYGVPLVGPPSHPFNSIYALRSVCALAEPAQRWALTLSYFRAAWAEGQSLEDLEVLKRCLRELHIDQDPEAVATERAQRVLLKENTKALLELGGWGAPTFEVDDLLFFGHDRLEVLLGYLQGNLQMQTQRRDELLSRPGLGLKDR